MRLLALTTLIIVIWSMMLDIINGMQLQSNKPKSSSFHTYHSDEEISKNHHDQQDQRQSSSRRGVLRSIAAGVATAVPVASYSTHIPNAAASTPVSKAFRAYQVQPDSGEKLNPTLLSLTVTFKSIESLDYFLFSYCFSFFTLVNI